MHVSDPLPHVGDRVVLRRLAITDLADFQAYRQDPEVCRWQGWSVTSDAEAAAFIARMAAAALFQPGRWCQIGIANCTTDILIGDIGLCVAENEEKAELGISLNRRFQGQGLAAEAVRLAIELVFRHTAVNRVVGITDVRNLRCIRLLERAGMRKTETLTSVFRGQPCSEHVFALSRDRGG